MKHDAIVEQGIPIYERVPIPDDLIPEDSRVEIDAKIHAGYCISPIHTRYLLASASDYQFSHYWESYEYGGTLQCARTSLG
jgi:hypothetical protein